MASDEAWERVLIFTKAGFDDVQTREGKKVKKVISTLGALVKLVEMHQSKIVQIEKELKGLKKEK
jgi:hypothetical protein